MRTKLSQIQGIKLPGSDSKKEPTLGEDPKKVLYLAQLGPKNSVRDKLITLSEKESLQAIFSEV
jgi:hypothetical protein